MSTTTGKWCEVESCHMDHKKKIQNWLTCCAETKKRTFFANIVVFTNCDCFLNLQFFTLKLIRFWRRKKTMRSNWAADDVKIGELTQVWESTIIKYYNVFNCANLCGVDVAHISSLQIHHGFFFCFFKDSFRMIPSGVRALQVAAGQVYEWFKNPVFIATARTSF